MVIECTILFMLGLGRSGKTETLRAFFGPNRGRKPWVKTLSGIPVMCAEDSSLQEVLGKKKSKRLGKARSKRAILVDLKGRIKICNEYCRSNKYGRFILIVPMTIHQTEGEVTNEELITDPIEWAKARYETNVVYLQKLACCVEELAEKIGSRTTIRGIEDYDRQSGNLEEFLKLITI